MVTDEVLGDGSFSTCRYLKGIVCFLLPSLCLKGIHKEFYFLFRKCINVKTGLHYAVKVISKR